MTIADRTYDDLPPDIHARIMAATAHATVRVIQKRPGSDPQCPHGLWDVDALSGDRFVHMTLGVREDGSVFEETRTFLTSEILDVSFAADGAAAAVAVQGPAGRETLSVPVSIGRALNRPQEAGLERSVKDVGRGLAGRIKQVAGELLEDPALEQEGKVQQREAEARRAESQ